MSPGPVRTETERPVEASIVIPTFRRPEDLMECLESVFQQPLEQYHAEVIVIDDASGDQTVDRVRQRFPAVRILVNDQNQGPARSRNRAAAIAQGTILLFLDSDGAVTQNWLAGMMAAHDGDTLLLGCAVDYASGRVQRLPRRATFIGKSLRCRKDRANTGPSCNLGVPRRCFEALGGFDEEIPYYFEDSDLCIRARKAGFRFQYLPHAVFRHKGSDIMRGDAIEKQEHNSTYAMLKAYRNQPVQKALFTLINGLWLIIRLLRWGLSGRWGDCSRLGRGWRSAYVRFRSGKG